MQQAIYAGLRNPERDLSILYRIEQKSVAEVAAELKCAPSTVRAAAKRIADLKLYTLKLTGGGVDMPICAVYAKTFRRAALAAFRHYCGTFRNLELSTWQVTDGTHSIDITELRAIDSGAVSVND
ncbi:hypothetical protein ACS8E9_09535 [Pseudomonas neustonica]|uniref:hypothetical protein n=1 Tax=Pseudomonas neustonica TaxID=2487346 RepID=UPI003F45FF2F